MKIPTTDAEADSSHSIFVNGLKWLARDGENKPWTLLLLAVMLLSLGYVSLRKWRYGTCTHFREHFPRRLLYGHIGVIASGYSYFGDSRRHFDYIVARAFSLAANPSILFLDLRPTMYPMVIIRSHAVAEQISRSSKLFPTSTTKSPTLQSQMGRLIGAKSILSAEGDQWKHLRKTFNPGFAPQHLLSLLPQIVDKTRLFLDKLDALATPPSSSSSPPSSSSSSSEYLSPEFTLDPLCTQVTFDIIGKVIMDIDFHAQDSSGGHALYRYYSILGSTYSDTGRLPVWMNVRKMGVRIVSGWLFERAVRKAIREKFGEMGEVAREEKEGQNGMVGKESGCANGMTTKEKENGTANGSSNGHANGHVKKEQDKHPENRSVLALALKSHLKDKGKTLATMTPSDLSSTFLQSTADQIRTFLFAGHDTTSILLQWAIYALSIHPHALSSLSSELDAVFGPRDPLDVFLESPEATLRKLTYTSAVIKETLRLWPPAASARMAMPGAGCVLHADGEDVCVDGCVLYVCQYLIQRDPEVYGETATEFCPERWLGDSDTSSDAKDEAGHKTGANGIPISAWRPFERGPRNCIGQELANLEARVILACVARRYEFFKVGAGEVELGEDGKPVLDDTAAGGVVRYKTKGELFNSMVITSKPFDGTRVRVRFREQKDVETS